MANPALDQLSQLMNLKGTQQSIQTQQFKMDQARQSAQQEALVRDYLNRVSPQVSQALASPDRQSAVGGIQQLLTNQPAPGGVDPSSFYEMVNTAYGRPTSRTGQPFFERVNLGDRVRIYTSPTEYTEEMKAASPSSGNYGGVSQYVGRDDQGRAIIFSPQSNQGRGGFSTQGVTEGAIGPRTDKNLPSEQIDFLEKADTLQDQIRSMSDLMAGSDEWQKWVGPVDARLGRLQDVTGIGADEERSVFQSTMQDIQNMIIYMRSGKQINESEYQRIRKAMPDIYEEETAFGAKWGKFMDTFSNVLENREERLKDQPGYRRSVGTQKRQPSGNGAVGVQNEGTNIDFTNEQLDAALIETGGDVDAALDLLERGAR